MQEEDRIQQFIIIFNIGRYIISIRLPRKISQRETIACRLWLVLPIISCNNAKRCIDAKRCRSMEYSRVRWNNRSIDRPRLVKEWRKKNEKSITMRNKLATSPEVRRKITDVLLHRLLSLLRRRKCRKKKRKNVKSYLVFRHHHRYCRRRPSPSSRKGRRVHWGGQGPMHYIAGVSSFPNE